MTATLPANIAPAKYIPFTVGAPTLMLRSAVSRCSNYSRRGEFNIERSFLSPAAIGAGLPPGCVYLLETSIRNRARGQTELR